MKNVDGQRVNIGWNQPMGFGVPEGVRVAIKAKRSHPARARFLGRTGQLVTTVTTRNTKTAKSVEFGLERKRKAINVLVKFLKATDKRVMVAKIPNPNPR